MYGQVLLLLHSSLNTIMSFYKLSALPIYLQICLLHPYIDFSLEIAVVTYFDKVGQ